MEGAMFPLDPDVGDARFFNHVGNCNPAASAMPTYRGEGEGDEGDDNDVTTQGVSINTQTIEKNM